MSDCVSMRNYGFLFQFYQGAGSALGAPSISRLGGISSYMSGVSDAFAIQSSIVDANVPHVRPVYERYR